MTQIALSSAAVAFELPDPANREHEVFLKVGGVRASVRAVTEAHSILQDSPGLMVRQPLARYRNPLALCNYHQEAAPYRIQYYGSLSFTGKGAAGRPATKFAFMHALRVRSAEAMRDAPYELGLPLLASEAYEAFGQDVSYVLAMVKLAVSVQAKQHAWRLRSELRQAQQEAMARCQQDEGAWSCHAASACGTGECPLASGAYKKVTAVAGPGKAQRPPRHVPGGAYGLEQAAQQLEQLVPFRVAAVL